MYRPRGNKPTSRSSRLIIKIIAWALLIFWCGVIFYFSNANGSESSALSGGILSYLHLDIDEYLLRKIAHFSEYLILGLLALNVALQYVTISRKAFIASIIFCAIYAASDEFHQSFIGGRSPLILDVCIDTAGAICANIIVLSIYYLTHKNHNKKT